MSTPDGNRGSDEVIGSLRQQLAEKERQLAHHQWAFQQILRTRSWRVTAPLRWLDNRIRDLTRWRAPADAGRAPAPQETVPPPTPDPLAPPAAPTVDGDRKKVFTEHALASLDAFLLSGMTLDMTVSERPQVSIILVLFNRAELTLACLRSIAESHSEPLEVIIVDNASTDQTTHLLSRLRGCRVIQNAENRGFLAAVNQAAAVCRGEYLLLLNNDAQLLPGSLGAAVRTLASSDDIGAVGAKIILLDGSLQEAGSIVWQDGTCLGYARGESPSAPACMFRRDVDYCSGAFLLTRRSLWEQLGGFDNRYAPAYYEETDFCMRLWEHGHRVVYEPQATIMHYEFASSQSPGAAVSLQRRNQPVFAEAHREALRARHHQPDQARVVFARSRHTGPRVLFLDDRPPHHWQGSGFPRANEIIRSLVRHGAFVTMFPLAAVDESWDVSYRDIPREVEVMNDAHPDGLEQFLRARAGYYDTILVSRPHNMEKLRPLLSSHPELLGDAELVYDAEALFAFRTATLRALSGDPMSPGELKREVTAEASLAAGADRVVAVSEVEASAFREHGIERVTVLSHAVTPTVHDTEFTARSGLLFVGAIHDETSPNGDSMLWFISEVLPLVHKALGTEVDLTIAGLNRSPRLWEVSTPKIKVLGPVENLESLYSAARVFVAPTRYSAGIPLKVVGAAANGLPVVATEMLAQQLGWTEAELGIANTAGEFAARCVELYTSSELWSRRRQAALTRIRSEFSPERFESAVSDLINSTSA